MIPHKKKLTFVYGKPIDVEKVENPTKEQVQELHAKYMKQFIELWEGTKELCPGSEKPVLILQ